MNAEATTAVANFDSLLNSIRHQKAKVGILGLGYVGTPLMTTVLKAGFDVIGFDVTESRVADFKSKTPYLKPWVLDELWPFVDSGKADATTDFSRLSECDVLIVCVPTPLDAEHRPDLGALRGACNAILDNARPGQLVVIESTSYPGTTHEYVVEPALARGIALGSDLFVAYSPEREDPGNKSFDTHSIPKVVGADDDKSRELAEAFYSQVVSTVVPVSSIAVAESSKVFENSFRAVNIAFVNEMKQVFTALGVDVWEVIDAAATKPFGFMPFYPGPGIGGHCIPVDPLYLSWKAIQLGHSTQFIKLAHEVNTSMPGYVVGLTHQAIEGTSDPRVLVVGLAYKKNVGDLRESPSLDIIRLFTESNVAVGVHDPHFSSEVLSEFGEAVNELTQEIVDGFDAVVVLTEHDDVNWKAIANFDGPVVDTRNTSYLGGARANLIRA